jgi:hypothetical protein
MCSFWAKYFVFICFALYKVDGWYNRKAVLITTDYISVMIEEAKQIPNNIQLVSEGNLKWRPSGLSLCRSPFILLWGNLIQNLPYVLPTKFWFICLSSFREKRFLQIDQPKTRIAYGSHVCQLIGTKWKIEDLTQMLPTKFDFIWLNGFRRKALLEIDQSETRLPVTSMFVNRSGQNEQS